MANTKAAGGNIERTLVRRRARRMKQIIQTRDLAPRFVAGYETALDELIAWLDAQPARTLRVGGLGRK